MKKTTKLEREVTYFHLWVRPTKKTRTVPKVMSKRMNTVSKQIKTMSKKIKIMPKRLENMSKLTSLIFGRSQSHFD